MSDYITARPETVTDATWESIDRYLHALFTPWGINGRDPMGPDHIYRLK